MSLYVGMSQSPLRHAMPQPQVTKILAQVKIFQFSSCYQCFTIMALVQQNNNNLDPMTLNKISFIYKLSMVLSIKVELPDNWFSVCNSQHACGKIR